MSNNDTDFRNEFWQPVGRPIDVTAAAVDDLDAAMAGTYCRLELLDVESNGSELFAAFTEATDDGDWTYLPYGPFVTEDEFIDWLKSMEAQSDPMFFTIIDSASGLSVGLASYLRIDARNATIEVGHIHLSRRLQKTAAATEAMYLMMRRAFDSGFRRYEWKCDDLNGPSMAAAKRLGFHYEGTFRQATHYKGRNRDTAWFAIIDSDWPDRRAEFERWLSPDNFDDAAQQLSSLRHSLG